MKRREFVQNFALVSGGLLLATSPAIAGIDADKDKRKGTVTSKGKKLADVVVSDGFSLVKTDKRGQFELPYNEQARFIFISVPAGYEFPQEKGVARHYYSLADAGTNAFNFELTPLKTDDSKHTFIIWADPQVKNAADVKMMMQQSVPDVQKLVQSLGENALVHGIGVGDLVWDNHDLFPKYSEAVAAMNIPFFQVIGNHDMDYRQGGDETSDKTFQKLYGPSYYSFNRGKVHYIVLDDVRYLGKEREYDGFVSDQQLNWMKKDLALVPKDYLIILNAHIPIFRVKNSKDIYALLKGRKTHIMTGHTHYNQNVIEQGIYEHNHGTVCGAWWTGPICGDGTPSGYGVYEVNGTDLIWYYKSTGLDKKHQVSVHIEHLTNQKRMMANVWNWDPEWKVEWFADGKPMGKLENIKALDPVAVALYQGDKLPAKRGFAEPTRTDHLFIVHFKPGITQVKVVATDRFGNKYEKLVTV